MAAAQLRPHDGETEVAAQMAVDLSINWETPSTPPHPDDYIIIHGSRLVRPYFFEFLAHVKRRWAGKTVVDLFAGEFRQRPREYYEEAVRLARIRVEGKMVAPSYTVRDSETMSHFVHRHEPPVIGGEVTILEEGPDVITVCKPASVPVHPCGQYRKNTVVSILEAEHKTGPLFRLLILARNSRTADFFRQEIEAGVVEKQYIAKVKGVFPEEEVEVNAAVLYDPREGRSSVEVLAPATVVAGDQSTPKGGLRRAPGHDVKGKEACTRFRRLSTNGVDSIVRCMPQTGRTHQIRVHLQYLDFPIANDALYLHSNVAKRSKKNTTADRAAAPIEASEALSRETDNAPAVTPAGIAGDTRNDRGSSVRFGTALFPGPTKTLQGDVIADDGRGQELKKSGEDVALLETGRMRHLKFKGGDHLESDASLSREVVDVCQLEEENHLPALSQTDSTYFVVDPLCTHCPNLEPNGYVGDDEGLWLHCIRYAGSNWAYECPLPEWAL